MARVFRKTNDLRRITIESFPPRYEGDVNNQPVHAMCDAEMIILPATGYVNPSTRDFYEKGSGILVECSNSACRYRTLLDRHRLYDLCLLGERVEVAR